jgi:hypothetical protein
MRRDRASLLHETAVGVGRQWFHDRCADLGRQRRRIEGGWPGTLTEARALVRPALTLALSRTPMPLATAGEVTMATRTTYDEARRAWLASRESGEGDAPSAE